MKSKLLLDLLPLEDRVAPALFRWTPVNPFVAGNWNNPANWREQVGASWEITGRPTEQDDVRFQGDVPGVFFNVDCIVNAEVKVKSITIAAGYTSAITLQSPLTLSGGFSYLGSNATIRGPEDQRGILKVEESPGLGAAVRWVAGSFQSVNVDLRPGAAFEVVNGDATQVRSMTDTHIRVWGSAPTPELAAKVGRLTWNGGDVAVAGTSEIRIEEHASFHVQTGGATWGTAVGALRVTNFGTVSTFVAGTAKINGQFTNHALTEVRAGTFELGGQADQGGPGAVFDLQGRSTVKLSGPDRVLGIRDGRMIGDGTVDGNLVLGNDPTAPGYGQLPPVSPVLAPGDDNGVGTIDVSQNFHMFSGRIEIDVTGPNANQYDRVAVVGYAALTGTIVGRFVPDHVNFPAGTQIVFLTYAQRLQDFQGQDITRPWIRKNDATQYWFERGGIVRGKVMRDDNGNGVFEPALGETALGGVGVTLLDTNGVQLGTTTTAADGTYDFGYVGYGDYSVRFDRPTELRPSPRHALGASPDADSDMDALTFLAAVTLSESFPESDPHTDALFRPLAATADAYVTRFQEAVSGNVLDNDPPPAGDPLAVALFTDPAHGMVVLGTNGAFTYTPDDGYYGTDSFEYRVTDAYGHAVVAVVSITVAPPPPAVVSGRLFNDGWEYTNGSAAYDRNGVQDAGAAGYAGVAVQLLDATGAVVAATQTDGSGYYVLSLTITAAGSYRVRFALPTSTDPMMTYRFTAANQGASDAVDSDADPATGETAAFTMTYGGTYAHDAGVIWRYDYSI